MGTAGVKELRRCIDNRVGFVGYAVSASKSPPGSDPSYAPFYKLCIEAGIPILFFVGTTGLGAGLPGGGGVILDNCHPRHLDLVAVHYPELKIMAARPGWPWQTETIAVLMHKRNIWYELHGWSPKYHSADLKHDIPRRLKDRVMFGGDYPLFGYERLVKDWIGRRLCARHAGEALSPQRRSIRSDPGAVVDLKLKDKVAIVGGASQGIGFGIARTLAAEGVKLAITRAAKRLLREARRKNPRRDRHRTAGTARRLPPRRGLCRCRGHDHRPLRRPRHSCQQ